MDNVQAQFELFESWLQMFYFVNNKLIHKFKPLKQYPKTNYYRYGIPNSTLRIDIIVDVIDSTPSVLFAVTESKEKEETKEHLSKLKTSFFENFPEAICQ